MKFFIARERERERERETANLQHKMAEFKRATVS